MLDVRRDHGLGQPDLKGKELKVLLDDSGAEVLVCLESLYHSVAADVLAETEVREVITTSELDFIEGEAPGPLADSRRERLEGTRDLLELARAHEGEEPEPVALGADDIAFLTYTSGTTGHPKSAMNTHANVVDDSSGALSVGVPIFNTTVRILDEEGNERPVGEVGEICTRGPQVVPGYWNKPEESEHAIPDGELHTGDVGFMDEQGFFHLVDRAKDQINVSGYKMWPREVEDALLEHEAVKEAPPTSTRATSRSSTSCPRR